MTTPTTGIWAYRETTWTSGDLTGYKVEARDGDIGSRPRDGRVGRDRRRRRSAAATATQQTSPTTANAASSGARFFIMCASSGREIASGRALEGPSSLAHPGRVSSVASAAVGSRRTYATADEYLLPTLYPRSPRMPLPANQIASRTATTARAASWFRAIHSRIRARPIDACSGSR